MTCRHCGAPRVMDIAGAGDDEMKSLVLCLLPFAFGLLISANPPPPMPPTPTATRAVMTVLPPKATPTPTPERRARYVYWLLWVSVP